MALSPTDNGTLVSLQNIVISISTILDKESAIDPADRTLSDENLANLNDTLGSTLLTMQAIISPVGTMNSSPDLLTGLDYVVGAGPSAAQALVISGYFLIGDLVISAPTDYEISLSSGTGYTTSLTFTPVGYQVDATTIYVRLKAGLSAAAYSEDLTLSSDGLTDVLVNLSGTVTAP